MMSPLDDTPCCAAGADLAGGATPRPLPARSPTDRTGQIRIDGGVFAMGDHFDEGYSTDGEVPVHRVELAPFHLDPTPVTNTRFAAFVEATGWVTDAEDLGISAVFHLAYSGDSGHVLHPVAVAPWWLAVRGADWRHPDGPGSGIEHRADHPVVHVSWRDARAYCAWAGTVLPTEAQWEYAARGGLVGARYGWGDELTPEGRWRCNIWQGHFPDENSGDDGHLGTAPVAAYRPNGYGLYQMSGNVWEWCRDWYDPSYYAQSPTADPTGPHSGTSRVMRGGSYLCHRSYCHRYRVAARSSSTPDSASANIGFRCANPDPEHGAP